MQLDCGLRRASYVALAVSCVCLLHSEAMFLPGIGWFLPLVLALLATAYRLEGRWALPVWTATGLAVLFCGGMAITLAAYPNDNPDSFAASVPFPVAMVPFAGPLFKVLLLLKVFRARRPGDAWQLQAMGLLLVALACVLGGDSLFGLLLGMYFVSALWWLLLF